MARAVRGERVTFKNIDCEIEGPLEDPYGSYSNAIKLTADGTEVLIDFCVYSAAENRARVVSRIRVAIDFLPIIHEKIGRDLNLSDLSDGGSVLFMMPQVGGDH
jgi:hypothetical protein